MIIIKLLYLSLLKIRFVIYYQDFYIYKKIRLVYRYFIDFLFLFID